MKLWTAIAAAAPAATPRSAKRLTMPRALHARCTSGLPRTTLASLIGM